MYKIVRVTLCVFYNAHTQTHIISRARERESDPRKTLYICAYSVFRWISKRNWTIYETKVSHRVHGQLENSSQFCLYGDADEWALSTHSTHPNIWIKSKRLNRRKESVHEQQDENKKKEIECMWKYIIAIYMVYFPFASRLFTNIMHAHTLTHAQKRREKKKKN